MTAHDARPVVAGVDGSPAAVEAVRWAAADAVRRGRPLRLVAVVDQAAAEQLGGAVDADQLRRCLLRGTRANLDEAAGVAVDISPGIDVDREVREGRAVTVLRDESERAELVVVGSRGRGGFAGLLAGSVSVSLAATASCPVVVVRGEVEPRAQLPVVVGVDGSPTSEAAIALAFDAAAARRVPLVAVHVWGQSMFNPFEVPMIDWEDFESAEGELLAERLAGWSQKYPDVDVRRVLVRDSPAATLVANSERAQLVVVGSRGHGPVGGLVLGSVGQALVRHGSCPVAIVRPAARRSS